jgi:hypothetical protein
LSFLVLAGGSRRNLMTTNVNNCRNMDIVLFFLYFLLTSILGKLTSLVWLELRVIVLNTLALNAQAV